MSENKGFNELWKDNKGFNIQEETKLDNYTDIYTPWQTKKRLRIWYEVEWNIWSGGWISLWFHTIPRLTPTWNYNLIDTTNINFVPRFIRIQAVMTSGRLNWYSDMSSSWTITWGTRYEGYDLTDDAWIWYPSSTRIILVAASNTTTTYNLSANFVEFITGWIRINITENDAIDDIVCTITAYK